MILSAADFVYDGSTYAAMTAQDRTTGLIAMLMTGVLLLGMLRRVKSGFGGIRFENAIVLVLYAGSVDVGRSDFGRTWRHTFFGSTRIKKSRMRDTSAAIAIISLSIWIALGTRTEDSRARACRVD